MSAVMFTKTLSAGTEETTKILHLINFEFGHIIPHRIHLTFFINRKILSIVIYLVVPTS